LLTNLETRVSITLGSTLYSDVRLFWVVFSAVVAGAAAMGVLAMVEGAGVRLANRRLRREIHRLETEVNYLRTQPAVGRAEPDAIEPPEARPARVAVSDRTETLASAPVYVPGDTDLDDDVDPDDDAYSGGRAV
jgi:hypothetical protein